MSSRIARILPSLAPALPRIGQKVSTREAPKDRHLVHRLSRLTFHMAESQLTRSWRLDEQLTPPPPVPGGMPVCSPAWQERALNPHTAAPLDLQFFVCYGGNHVSYILLEANHSPT